MKVFSGSAHPALAAEICQQLGIEQGRVQLERFSDGEVYVQVPSPPREPNPYVLQLDEDTPEIDLDRLAR